LRKSQLDKQIDHVIKTKVKAVDMVIKEIIKPLRVTENPEDLIGKPYAAWTPEDKTMLMQIYGTQEPNTLSRFIFNKEYELLKELEREEL